ncbi:NAD(P)H-binding protein [Deinococcus sp. RM]|uniref:NAD(P)H-binding protein n=1 Tax=Deinococcus sp. RM TaxID=2316359 RepID=UPI000E692497|nr:NAD(P)H-binding protein [Deinococcus sp. RM]RIY01802.1 hypothetical protein D3W47_15035 [Deinococcus sp. RM]
MILVTAATGNVGRELMPQLLGAGLPVRAGSRHPDPARWPDAEVVTLDLTEQDNVRAAAQGVTAAYLIVPETLEAADVQATLRTLRDAGVARVVLQSGFGVQGGGNLLGDAEAAVRASGLEWTILQPNWFMQNYNQMFRRGIRDRHEFAEPAGTRRTSVIDTRDIAAAAVTVLTGDGHVGRVYPLTGPASLDRHEVAAALSRALCHEVTYRPVDDDGFVDFLVSTGESDEEEARGIASIYPPIRADATAPITDDLPRLIGRAGYTIDDFARHYRADWQA